MIPGMVFKIRTDNKGHSLLSDVAKVIFFISWKCLRRGELPEASRKADAPVKTAEKTAILGWYMIEISYMF